MALFVQAMLSKVKSWKLYNYILVASNDEEVSNYSNNNRKNVLSYTTNQISDYVFETEIKTSTYWGVRYVNCNWGDVYSNSITSTNYTKQSYIFEKLNTTIPCIIQIKSLSSSGVIYAKNSKIYRRETLLNWSVNNIIKWYPRQLKEISKKATTTIFWIHIDNSRVTQDAE